MFVGKARSLPYSGTPERCLTVVGSSLTRKYQIKLERPGRGEHFSLLRIFINYKQKLFIYNIGPGCFEKVLNILFKYFVNSCQLRPCVSLILAIDIEGVK